jgi:hypothetical protein
MSDVPKKRRVRAWIGWAAIPLMLYVGGYFMLGDHSGAHGMTIRVYPSRAVALSYTPLGWIESRIRQRSVYLFMPSEGEVRDRFLFFQP